MPGKRSVTLRLSASLGAAKQARDKVRSVCSGLPVDLVADALLLTRELVTNAAKFTAAMITVAVECDGSAIAVAVADDSQEPPVLRDPADDASGGRGLQLVDSVARAWGWWPRADDAGKVVWFRVGSRGEVNA